MLSETTQYLITVIATTAIALAEAAGLLAAKPERRAFFDRLARHRKAALFIGWAALAVCVPHARVVSPDFLTPFLWPLAVIFPILGYFYLDFALARAVAGAMILCAYFTVHLTFDLKLPTAPVLAVLSWLFGIAGIWVSARPRAFRDAFRLAAENRAFKGMMAAALMVYALLLAASFIGLFYR